MSENNFNQKSKKTLLSTPSLIMLILVLLFISGILGTYYYYFIDFTIDANVEHFAQFGDFIGGTLNPILAFFAFLALLFTIKLQSDALEISKNELKATREELEKSRIAQEEQSKSLVLQNTATKQQIFENTFFKLTEQFFQSKNNLKDGSEKSIDVINSMLIFFKLHQLPDYQANSNDTKKSIQTIYDEYNKYKEDITGIYFGQIYQILKFIHVSKIVDKQRYADILRAQFTKNELEFLFYHCLGSIGKRKFKPLIEQYEFFEHISINEDITPLIKEYKANAFGKNEEILTLYKSL
ncbi:MAG: putative phage abortive infection protein [Arcobacteraceae bacterium]|nr:putative phage abortive infection protein [Arcobacteraceae bacterium]